MHPSVPPPFRIGSPQELSERLTHEYARGGRHGTALSLLALHFFLWDGSGSGALARIRSHLAQHFAVAIRISDGLYEFGRRGCFVGVLPLTKADDAHVPRARLEERARARPLDEVGPVKIDVIRVGVEAPDVESLLVLLQRHFESQSLLPGGEGRPPPPPERVPLRGVAQLERTLRIELNLAGRDASSLSVMSLFAIRDRGAPPGLLARHVARIAPRVVRPTDPAFSVGPSHVVLVLPRTAADEAAAIGQRVICALAEAHPHAPYGEIAQRAFEFDRAHRDVPSILATLRRIAPVAGV